LVEDVNIPVMMQGMLQVHAVHDPSQSAAHLHKVHGEEDGDEAVPRHLQQHQC
jgi:hypothetical protein